MKMKDTRYEKLKKSALRIEGEVVPKHCYREGDTRSKLFECLKLPPVAPPRTLPRVAIPNGKPFHHFCLEYGSD
ncbi:hypothetical protein, partial [Methanoculleus sp.]|uniref:hypothetical protein n=1 Tax=Methanoculleus sp. TaxID=90427 RepID=UPI001BD23DF7